MQCYIYWRKKHNRIHKVWSVSVRSWYVIFKIIQHNKERLIFPVKFLLKFLNIIWAIIQYTWIYLCTYVPLFKICLFIHKWDTHTCHTQVGKRTKDQVPSFFLWKDHILSRKAWRKRTIIDYYIKKYKTVRMISKTIHKWWREQEFWTLSSWSWNFKEI